MKALTLTGRLRLFAILLATILTIALYIRLSFASFESGRFRGDFAAIWQPLTNVYQTGQPSSSFNISVHTLYSDLHYEAVAQNSKDLDNFNQFAIHTHFYLIPLGYLGRVVESPYFLLIVQACSFGGFVFFLGYRGVLKNVPTIPLIGLLLAFAVSPFSLGLIANDFHFDSLAGLSVGFFALLLLKESPSWMAVLVWAVATAAIKDSFVGLVLGAGLCLVTYRGRSLKGFVLIIFGITSYLLIIKVLVPYFSGGGGFLFDGVYGSKLGDSMAQILMNSVKHPALFWEVISTEENLKYLAILAVSCPLFFIFESRVLLLCSAFFFVNIVSSNNSMKFAWGQYNAVVICAMHLASVEAYPRVAAFLNGKGGRMLAYPILAVILVAPLVLARQFGRVALWEPSSAFVDVQKDALLTLDRKLIVGADDSMANFLANRKSLYLFPLKLDSLDVVVLSNDVDIKPWYLPDPLWTKSKEVLNSEFTVLYRTPRYLVWGRKSKDLSNVIRVLKDSPSGS